MKPHPLTHYTTISQKESHCSALTGWVWRKCISLSLPRPLIWGPNLETIRLETVWSPLRICLIWLQKRKELPCAHSKTRQLPGCVWWFPKKGGKGRHWDHGGESTVLDVEGGYLFKCWASFLVMSHFLGILGKKYLKPFSEPGNWGVSSIWQYLSLQYVHLDGLWRGTKVVRARKIIQTEPISFLSSESLAGLMLWSPSSHSLRGPGKEENSAWTQPELWDFSRVTQHPWMQNREAVPSFYPKFQLTLPVMPPIHAPLCSPAGYLAAKSTFPSTSPSTTAALKEWAEKLP